MPGIHTKLIAVIVAALLAGTAAGEEKDERHMHRLAKDVDALHAVLAPLWHARAGQQRARDVCAQADKLENLAREVHSGDAKTLLASIADLKARCQASPSDIDAVFSQVHEAFHRLAEPQSH